MELVAGIAPERLVIKLHGGTLKDAYFGLDSDLNTVIGSLRKDEKQKQQSIDELKFALHELEDEHERQVAHIRESDSGSMAAPVLAALRIDLASAADELVEAAMQSPSSVERLLNDIVRQSLSREIRQASERLSLESAENFAQSAVAKVDANLRLSEDWVSSLLEQLKNPLLSILQPKGAMGQKGGGGGGIFASLGAMGIGLASKLHPLLTVALAILPGVVDMLLGSLKERRQREAIQQALNGQVFPDVLRQVRPEVERFLRAAAEEIVAVIAREFNQRIESQRSIYEATEREGLQDKDKLNQRIELIAGVRQRIAARAESDIFGHPN